MSAARKYVLLDYTRYSRLKQRLESIDNQSEQTQLQISESSTLPVSNRITGDTQIITDTSLGNGNGNEDMQIDREQQLLSMFPKQVRQKCAILLKYLMSTGAVYWTDNNTLHINKTAIPGSNIIDLLRYCFFPKQYVPIGWNHFCPALHHLNVPISIIGNPVARQDVINGYSTSNADDQMLTGYGLKARDSDLRRERKQINNVNFMQGYNVNGVSTLPKTVINHRKQVSSGHDTFQQPMLQVPNIPNPPGLTQAEFLKLQRKNKQTVGAGRVKRNGAAIIKSKTKQIKWLQV